MILHAINQECEPHRITKPMSDEVSAALRRLDARTLTMVTLEVNSNHHMGIGGGNGNYVVYLTLDNMHFKNLVDRSRSGSRLALICGGQEGEFDIHQCVDLETAEKAANFFAFTGEAEPSLEWEDQ